MSKYLFVESKDPFETPDVLHFYALAAGLARDHHPVTLFLVQKGVLLARLSERSTVLSELVGAGVDVLADEQSLRERGIETERLTPGVLPASLDVVLDQLADGRKAVWH